MWGFGELSVTDLWLLVPNLYMVIVIGIQAVMSFRVWYVYTHSKEHNHHYDRNPRVSIVVPAYNEEVTICDSVNSLLNQTYLNLDIIIINDGSKDHTLDKLIDTYRLTKSQELADHWATRYPGTMALSRVRGFYTDKAGKILLIDQANGGKSTALNAGILLSDSEYVLNVDADTLLVSDAVTNTLRKKNVHSDAVSCMVGIINGNTFSNENVKHPVISSKFLVRRQWLEYLSSFILWRAGTKRHNAVTVIPGAFGLIRREAILKVNGYKKECLAEDGELTLNLIKHGYRVQFIAEFMAWTEVPESIHTLGKQRLRWYRGTFQNMIMHRDMLFSRKYDFVLSFVVLPYIWFADVLGSWVEVITWFMLGYYLVMDIPVNWTYLITIYSLILITYGISMTAMIQFIKRKLVPREEKSRFKRLIIIVLLELFSYHFLNLFWILRSHVRELLGTKHNWNKIKRKGFKIIR